MQPAKDVERMPSVTSVKSEQTQAASDVARAESPTASKQHHQGLPMQPRMATPDQNDQEGSPLSLTNRTLSMEGDPLNRTLEGVILDQTVPRMQTFPATTGEKRTSDASLQDSTQVLAELCAQQAARIVELEQKLEWQRIATAQKSESQAVEDLREALEKRILETSTQCSRSQFDFEQLAAANEKLQRENQELFSEVRSCNQGLEALRREVQQMQNQGLTKATAPMQLSHVSAMNEDSVRVEVKELAVRPPSPAVTPSLPQSIVAPCGGSTSSWSTHPATSLSPLVSDSAPSVSNCQPRLHNSSGSSSVGTPAVLANRSGTSSPGDLRKIRHSALRNTSPVRLAAPPPPAGQSQQSPGSLTRGNTSVSPRTSAPGRHTSPRGKSPTPGLAFNATRRLAHHAGTQVRQSAAGTVGVTLSARVGRRSASAINLGV